MSTPSSPSGRGRTESKMDDDVSRNRTESKMDDNEAPRSPGRTPPGSARRESHK